MSRSDSLEGDVAKSFAEGRYREVSWIHGVDGRMRARAGVEPIAAVEAEGVA
jgi:hypothetical protein